MTEIEKALDDFIAASINKDPKARAALLAAITRREEEVLEEAAKGCEEYAEQKQAQHLNPTAYALREMAVKIRALIKEQP